MKVILKFTLLFFFNSQIRLYFMLSPSFFFLCLYVCCIATSIFVCCIHAVFFLTFSFRKFVRNLFFTFICLCQSTFFIAMSPCLQFAIFMGHPRPLFPLFSSFQYSGQLTFNIKFAEGCLRTVDLWFRKRPSHTTAQVCFFFA